MYVWWLEIAEQTSSLDTGFFVREVLQVSQTMVKYIRLYDHRNQSGPKPVALLCLPWNALHHVFFFLLQHPAGWTRRSHFAQRGECEQFCGCCLRRNSDVCGVCYTKWVMTQACKNMLHEVQMHNSPCDCRTCAKSWVDKGWECPDNAWHVIPSRWFYNPWPSNAWCSSGKSPKWCTLVYSPSRRFVWPRLGA